MPLSRFILLPPSSLHSRRTTTKNTPDLHPQTLSYGLHPQHFLTSKAPPSPFPNLFDQTPPPSSFQCNTLNRAHTQSHLPEAALLLFQKMLSDGRAPPDKFTFPLVLKACAQLSTLDEVEQIHCMILESQSVPADDVYVTTSLIRMYSQCSRTDEAQRLFDGMPNRNVITWNTMIDGFVKSNDMNSARRLFDEMPDRNVVFWNSLMGGYVRNESPHEALKIFIKLEWDCIAIADLWCVWKERNSRIFRFQANSYIKTIDITCSMLKSWLSQTKLQANIYLLNQIQNSRR